jgi:hypothetical protein
VAEDDLDLIVRRVGVFDRVVQQRRGQHHGILDVRLDQDVRELDRMVDVRRRFRVLAPAVAVLLGGKRGGAQHQFHVCGHR